MLLGLGAVYGTILSWGMDRGSQVLITNSSAAIFVVLNIFLLIHIYKTVGADGRVRAGMLAAVAVAAPIGILLGSVGFGTTERLFWVSDSVHTHHPSAQYMVSLLNGTAPINAESMTRALRPGALTHLWVGVWYLVFGPSVIVSVLALLVIKAVTVELLVHAYQKMCDWLGLKGAGSGIAVVLLYLGVPTVLFHTAVLYKEALVHLCFTAALLGALSLMLRPSFKMAGLLAFGVAGLLIERFYVAASLLPLLGYLAVSSLKHKKAVVAVFAVSAIAALIYFLGVENFSPEEVLRKIVRQREYHSSFSGVSQRYNYEVPYFVAFGKILMTPIWALNKLAMFHGLGALVTWGSFVHQVVMLAYLLCLLHLVRLPSNWKYLIVHVPFLIFVLFGAYISPWAGRVRDSYFPLIAIFATIYIACYLREDLARAKRLLTRAKQT